MLMRLMTPWLASVECVCSALEIFSSPPAPICLLLFIVYTQIFVTISQNSLLLSQTVAYTLIFA